MPEAEIAKRGGATKVRTKRLPNGRYITIYVVRTKGKLGGRTVAGPVKKRKR